MTFYSFLAKTLAIVILCLIVSCGDNSPSNANLEDSKATASKSNSNVKLFTQMPAEETGVTFENRIIENDEINYFQYQYLYNGGGVAIGDFNNDGLSDLYFSINFGLNRLYLNEGNWKFRDVTQLAGINTGMNWSTGVTLVDINNDGWLDIYQSCSGWFDDPAVRRNQLFINNGTSGDSKDVSFTESADEYGIADEGHSTQATFLDYDKDGDLDFYLANHPIVFNDFLGRIVERMANPPEVTRDKLYRNDGGKFTEVGKQAGINNHAFGLGVVASDFDKDGWTDIYVANDYEEHDYLYRNNGNGTFTDIIDQAIKHTSNTSMGVDAADFNNDGNLDLFSLDMMAEDNKRQKVNMAPMNPKLFWTFVKYGFQYQYMRNALQLNNGVLDGKLTFSEIAQMSNVATTDWSWAALFADLDNDGFKDLYITNGYKRDVLNKDEQKKLKPIERKINKTVKFTEIQHQMSATKTPNYAYQNKGDLTFKKQSSQWGLDNGEHSNGAAYADLDNDGDLDLVVNSLDSKMQLYRNESIGKANNGNHYLRIQLKGTTQNPMGLGAKVELKYGGEKQYAEHTITRGFQSACEPFLHFGLGKNAEIEELTIIWADHQMQKLQNVKTNQTLTLDHKNATQKWSPSKFGETLFEEVAAKSTGLDYQHKETSFNDYEREVLLPHKLSQNGPSLATGDVNGDGLEDVFIGGASGSAGGLFFQQADGRFSKADIAAFNADKKSEDMGALFLDADGDGDQDLYVVSGSNELSLQDAAMQDRLYTNDGKGNFSKNSKALPAMPTSGSCVKAADFDGDGDMDLMLGGRVLPGKYPYAPNSYLLQNEGGTFKDVTKERAPALQKIGMVTDAIWTDYDGDQDFDLIVVGEWMPIEVLQNNGGIFNVDTKALGLEKSNGWWNCIEAADIDGDGDMDYLLGNLGLNSKNKASEHQPFHVYSDDFDGNGKNDIVLGYYNAGVCYPVRGRQCSSEQMPSIAQKFPTYEAFGNSNLEQVYGRETLQKALHYEAYEMGSVYLENQNGKSLQWKRLPMQAQIAPTNDILLQDFNGDDHMDALLVGNQYPVEVETGRYDAHIGLYLAGDGKGNFEAVKVEESGFLIEGESRSMALLNRGNARNPLIVVARNDEKCKVFEVKSAKNKLSADF